MANLGKDAPNNQPVPSNFQEKASTYEDEINLIDYFRVFWKRKYFILLGSVLPALLVGLILFFRPRDYKVTYVYDVKDQSVYDISSWNLDEKNYKVLLDRFYSEGNINRIVNKLQKNGLAKYAELISKAGKGEDLKKFVDFEVLPPYVDISKAKITDPNKLEQIRQLKALLLKLTIIGRPKSDIPKISLVIRDNLESVIPVYFVEEHLNTAMQEYRAKMADIEENRFNLELALKRDKSILAKLKNIKAGTSDKTEGRIILEFDVGGRSEYLPVEYQIQATESGAIQLEEQIAANEKKYSYYDDLLTLNKKLFAELKDKTSPYYTIQQFHSFLTDLADSYKSKDLKDHLNSLIKKIENRVSAGAPVTEEPKVYGIRKGTVKKTAITFAVLLMMTIFAAFLLEGIQKSPAQAL